MVIKVSRDNLFFKFTPTMQPVVRVEQGVEVLLETHDCFKGQLKSEKELIDKLNWDYVNPATGPVFIEGVNPGDVLQIDLVKAVSYTHLDVYKRQALGISRIRLTGGEPLVRKGLLYLVEEIARVREISDLAMTTNGILLPDFAGSLKEAGLQLSLIHI